MLHYTTYIKDSNAKWVTFIHGAGGSSSIWFRQIKAFKGLFNVLLIDLRGHGKSKKPTTIHSKKYTFDKIGDDVIEVLDHLNINKTHWVGVSLGTIIIREITERFPERTDKMILAGAIMKLNLRGQILMKFGSIFKTLIPYNLLYRFFAFVIMPKKNHKESRNLFIKEAKKLYQKEFKKWFGLTSQINPLLKYFRINPPSHPTLYIMGAEDYMFLPSIAKLISDHVMSQLHVIANCGHVVNVEQPEIFNNQALAFLVEE